MGWAPAGGGGGGGSSSIAQHNAAQQPALGTGHVPRQAFRQGATVTGWGGSHAGACFGPHPPTLPTCRCPSPCPAAGGALAAGVGGPHRGAGRAAHAARRGAGAQALPAGPGGGASLCSPCGRLPGKDSLAAPAPQPRPSLPPTPLPCCAGGPHATPPALASLHSPSLLLPHPNRLSTLPVRTERAHAQPPLPPFTPTPPPTQPHPPSRSTCASPSPRGGPSCCSWKRWRTSPPACAPQRAAPPAAPPAPA